MLVQDGRKNQGKPKSRRIWNILTDIKGSCISNAINDGKEKGFCAKEKIKSYKCECGNETKLVNLKPLYTKCKCSNEFKYMTNMNTAEFTYKCFTCGSPVDVKMNSRRTAYITIGGVLKIIVADWLVNMECQ